MFRILRFTIPGGFDTASEGAVGEAGGELIAGGYLGGGSDEGATGREHESIAPVEDGQGGKRVQAGVDSAMRTAARRKVRSSERSMRALMA